MRKDPLSGLPNLGIKLWFCQTIGCEERFLGTTLPGPCRKCGKRRVRAK